MHLGPNYIQPGKRGEFQRTVQKQNFLIQGTAFSRCPMSKFLRCASWCPSAASGHLEKPQEHTCSVLTTYEAYSNMVTLSWFCLVSLCSFEPKLDSMQCFVLFVFEQRLGIVCGNSLGLYHHGLLNIRFYPFFGIHNKIVLHFSVQLHRWRIFFPLFLQGSKLKALRRTSRSPRLAAWKSSGWSIRERAILRAAQIFPEMAGWGTCCWFLLFLCKLRAVRKLLTASLRG